MEVLSMKLRALIFAAAWLGFGWTTAPNRTAEAAEADKLNVCYSSIAATSIRTWVPKELRCFSKTGRGAESLAAIG